MNPSILEPHSTPAKISSSTTKNNPTNGYQTYSFYILGHPTKSTQFKLSFGLGTTDEEATGEMYVGGITISKINHNIYSNASAGSNLKKIDLVGDMAYSSSPIYLDNGEFNAVEIVDFEKSYPAKQYKT